MKIALFMLFLTVNIRNLIFEKQGTTPVIKYLFCMISCMLGLHNDSIDPERKELLLDKLTSLAIELSGD